MSLIEKDLKQRRECDGKESVVHEWVMSHGERESLHTGKRELKRKCGMWMSDAIQRESLHIKRARGKKNPWCMNQCVTHNNVSVCTYAWESFVTVNGLVRVAECVAACCSVCCSVWLIRTCEWTRMCCSVCCNVMQRVLQRVTHTYVWKDSYVLQCCVCVVVCVAVCAVM